MHPVIRAARLRRLAVASAAAVGLAGTAVDRPAWAQSPAAMQEPGPQLLPGAQPSEHQRVEVKQYQVLGVTLLAPGAVEAALAGLTGQRTVEELHRAAGAVQALYVQAGYGAVVVFLPPQELSSGVVTLQVIEGRLAAVRVEGGAPAFSTAGVLASLPALKLHETPRLDLIDAQLRMANDNPAKRTRLVLLPGRQPEETEAEIVVEASARRQFSIELDNTGVRNTGRTRAGVAFRDANASGRDDVVELRLQTAPEHPRRFAAASLTYRLPLYAHATMLDAYVLSSDTRSDRLTTIAGDLRFSGKGHLLGLRATRYLSRFEGLDRRVSLGIERIEQRNQCAIGDFAGEACGGAGADLAITPLSLEFLLIGDVHRPLAVSASVVRGLAMGGRNADRSAFEAARPGARPEFTALRAQISGQHRLGAAGWSASARLAAQWAADPLVSAMQFGAGGRSSVRGYEERELSADHGLALSLELSTPVWQPASTAAALRPLVFADAAELRNRDDAPCSGTRSRCRLAAVGAGVRFELPSLSAGLDVARALRSGGTTARGQTRGHVWLRFLY